MLYKQGVELARLVCYNGDASVAYLLGTYAFGASTIAVNPFSDCVNLPSILSVRELLPVLMHIMPLFAAHQDGPSNSC